MEDAVMNLLLIFVVALLIVGLCLAGWGAYKEMTTESNIVRLEDREVMVGGVVIINVDGSKVQVVGPENCDAWCKDKVTVISPEKPGDYTVVIQKSTWEQYTDTYVIRVVVKPKELSDEPLPTSLELPVVKEETPSDETR